MAAFMRDAAAKDAAAIAAWKEEFGLPATSGL
jgi:hypothetical protein